MNKIIGYVLGEPIYGLFGGDTNLGGYNTEGDLRFVTLDGVDVNSLWGEFQATMQIYNEQRSHLVNLLTFPVNNPVETVPQVGEITFDEASEFGVPTSGRVELNYFQLGYDFRDYDKRSTFTWKFIRDVDARQVQALHQEYLTADNRLIFRKVMEAIFDNRNRMADIRNQAYSVFALYNADGTVPPPYKSTTFSGSHSHYLVTNSVTVDSGDLDAMYDHIAEHGYGQENGTQFVLLCNKAEIREIRKFKQGVVNNNSAVASYDFIPSPNQPALIVPNSEGLLGSRPADTWNGLRVTGSYGDILIIEESFIPASYLLMFGSGGTGNLQNLVGLREHANAAYRGLRLLPGNQQSYPLVESIYARAFGTGIRQRAGAVVAQLKASGSYDIPTQYKKTAGATA